MSFYARQPGKTIIHPLIPQWIRAHRHLGQVMKNYHHTHTLICWNFPGNSFGISEDPTTRAEIHKHLQRLAGAVLQ